MEERILILLSCRDDHPESGRIKGAVRLYPDRQGGERAYAEDRQGCGKEQEKRGLEDAVYEGMGHHPGRDRRRKGTRGKV